jgi:hypothetical protein
LIFRNVSSLIFKNEYPAQAVQQDFVYPPLEPQFIANGEFFPTTLSRYWQSPADITFLRHDTIGKPGGSLITQVFASGGPAYDWFRCAAYSLTSFFVKFNIHKQERVHCERSFVAGFFTERRANYSARDQGWTIRVKRRFACGA